MGSDVTEYPRCQLRPSASLTDLNLYRELLGTRTKCGALPAPRSPDTSRSLCQSPCPQDSPGSCPPSLQASVLMPPAPRAFLDSSKTEQHLLPPSTLPCPFLQPALIPASQLNIYLYGPDFILFPSALRTVPGTQWMPASIYETKEQK